MCLCKVITLISRTSQPLGIAISTIRPHDLVSRSHLHIILPWKPADEPSIRVWSYRPGILPPPRAQSSAHPMRLHPPLNMPLTHYGGQVATQAADPQKLMQTLMKAQSNPRSNHRNMCNHCEADWPPLRLRWNNTRICPAWSYLAGTQLVFITE